MWALAAALLLPLAACRREPPAQGRALAPDPPPPAPLSIDQVPPSLREAAETLNKSARPDWLQERNDRRELVLPAPASFQPEAIDRKLKLSIQLRETRIRKGDALWYRIEIRNVGRTPVHLSEGESFLKDLHSISEGDFRFVLTSPDGSTQTIRFTPRLVSGTEVSVKLPGEERWTKEEAKEIVSSINDYVRRVRGLSVNLLPGETIYSRARRDTDWVEEFFRSKGGEVPPDPAPIGFRPLRTDYAFRESGRYRIRVEFDRSGPATPSEEHLAAMERLGHKRRAVLANYRRWRESAIGIVISDSVEFEVTP